MERLTVTNCTLHIKLNTRIYTCLDNSISTVVQYVHINGFYVYSYVQCQPAAEIYYVTPTLAVMRKHTLYSAWIAHCVRPPGTHNRLITKHGLALVS